MKIENIYSFKKIKSNNKPLYFICIHESDISQIIKNVVKDHNKPRVMKFAEKLVSIIEKSNFIYTKEAIERLTILYFNLEDGINVLLEGPTGTSKTLSSEIVCEISERKLIKYSISSETKSSDLLGRYSGDSNSMAVISYAKSPFVTAFEEGYTLFLDDINLASPECIQFIKDAIDHGIINVELPGMPLREIHMHENFRIIAIYNPQKGAFTKAKQELESEFMSRFQCISFPAYTEKELIEIAQGLAKRFNCKCDESLINDFIKFHMKCADPLVNDVQCFTIREIAATIHCIAGGNNIYDTVMTIYGARYYSKEKEELRNLFLSYPSFKNLRPEENSIIDGSEGSGVTQLLSWTTQNYNNFNNIRISIIFDHLDEAPATVTEKLSVLLNWEYEDDDDDEYNVSENRQKNRS